MTKNWLKYLMAEKGLKQHKIAKTTGVKRQTVSGVVNGTDRVERVEVYIAKLLQLRPEDIWPLEKTTTLVPQKPDKAGYQITGSKSTG